MLLFTPKLDLFRVRQHLARITDRGYAREQDLEAKLAVVLRDVLYKNRYAQRALNTAKPKTKRDAAASAGEDLPAPSPIPPNAQVA